MREADLVLNFMSETALFRGKRVIVSEQTGVAKDGGERIVDFVGGPGGQAAESSQFLGVGDAFLDRF